QHLFGDAAANDAGSADTIFFCNCHFGTIRSGYPCSSYAARTGTNDKQVIIIFSHLFHSLIAQAVNARLFNISVDGSIIVPPPAKSALAVSLPNSTPNWSNGLMPKSIALTKVRCS